MVTTPVGLKVPVGVAEIVLVRVSVCEAVLETVAPDDAVPV